VVDIILDEFEAENLALTASDYRMTRINILIGAAASLICAPAIVRAASLMPVRGLPLQFLNPERRIPKTAGEWYQQCFYNNSQMT